VNTAFLNDIHRFWFGDLKGPGDLPEGVTDIWFRKSDETDRIIGERFGASIPEAASANLDPARLPREEAAALVVLFDQFPRNIFRTSAEAFAYDAKARAISRALIAGGLERFFWLERVAVILPFEHSEDLAD
jgi:uncharacterized protein (DUF924 family)